MDAAALRAVVPDAMFVITKSDNARNPGRRVQWRQARFTWHRDGRSSETGYFSYDYPEQAKPISIQVVE